MSSKTVHDKLPHWDLTNVYPSLESESFRHDVEKVRTLLDAMDQYLAENQIARGGAVPKEPAELSEVISGYLDRMNELLLLYYTLRSYIFSFVSTDSYNTTAKRILSEMEMLSVRLDRHEVLFRGWIGTVVKDAKNFDRALKLEGSASQHDFYLRETAEQSRFLMSEEEETLASELSLSGANAWQKLQGTVTSQLKVPFEREGKSEDLPITVIINMRNDPDGSIRRRAYDAEIGAWESVRESLAAGLNGVKGAVITLFKRRGREDALHEALDKARIDRGTLEAMLGAMYDSFPAFRRYWHAKAKRLGTKRLPWWDLMAPMGKSDQRYTYPKAHDFILEHFGSFSDRLVSLSRRAFDNNWIDAEPRDGKRGGAFCMSVPAVHESRILCNFDGSLDQLTTIAHELGHAYHYECQVGKQPLQRRTPMTLAETASIFCQTIVTDATLIQADGPEEELAILENFLIDTSQVIVDIYSRYLFEKEVFERRAEAELSADDFCEIMARAQVETYGDGLDPEHLHPYMWTWKPHYYSPGLSFYNFPYAFGLLFGLGLYALYQEQGQTFLADYDALLRSTGEGTAADLAARFGINIRRPAFWEGSLKVIEKRINRYVEL